MACDCHKLRNAPACRRPLTPGGTLTATTSTTSAKATQAAAPSCSAFDAKTKANVVAVWDPVSRVLQPLAGVFTMVTVDVALVSGPLLPIFAPLLFLSLCINVLPALVIELLIDCSPSGQMKRQATTMRQNLDVLRSLPANAPIPGWSDLRRAVDLLYPFVSAAERGVTPSAKDVAGLASAAGVLDALPPSVLGGLAAGAAVAGKVIPAATATGWSTASSRIDASFAAAMHRLMRASLFSPDALPAETAPAPYALRRAEFLKAKANGLHGFEATLSYWKAHVDNDSVPGSVLLLAVAKKQRLKVIEAAKEEAKAQARAKAAAAKPEATVDTVVKATKPSLWRTLLDNPLKTAAGVGAALRLGGVL